LKETQVKENERKEIGFHAGSLHFYFQKTKKDWLKKTIVSEIYVVRTIFFSN
jgi:hypothetical protein